MQYYKLDGKNVEPCTDAEYYAWRKDFNNMRVAYADIGRISISTTFLGMMRLGDAMFETLYEGIIRNEVISRYQTWDEAVEGHKNCIKMATEEDQNATVIEGLLDEIMGKSGKKLHIPIWDVDNTYGGFLESDGGYAVYIKYREEEGGGPFITIIEHVEHDEAAHERVVLHEDFINNPSFVENAIMFLTGI